MILTRTDTSATVTLPDDYYWEDEALSTVSQTIETSLTGAALIQVAARQWLPMTLRPWSDEASWLDQTARDTLLAWSRIPLLDLTLARDGVTHTLVWRYDGDKAVDDKPAFYAVNDTDLTANDMRYLVTLRFLRLNLE